MRRLQKIELFGGPMDGLLYTISTENGKLPSSVLVNVPVSVPYEYLTGSDLYPTTTTNPRVVEYAIRPSEPQHGLAPRFHYRPR